MSKSCAKCGKAVHTLSTMQETTTDRFHVCFCGLPGQRLFYDLFPEYVNMRPRPRRSRTRRPKAAW